MWLDLNMVLTWLDSREALNNMHKKATDVLLRSTVLHGTARWDSTFIQDIPGFISVERIVFHLYVVWQRHGNYFCERHECADGIGTVMSEIVARSSLRCPIRFTVTSTVVVLAEARR